MMMCKPILLRRNEFESGGGGAHVEARAFTCFGSTSTVSHFGERFRDGPPNLGQ